MRRLAIAAVVVAAAAALATLGFALAARGAAAGDLAANRARLLLNPMLADLVAKLPTVERWDERSRRLADGIEALGGTLVAVDLAGRVLFDSRDPGAHASERRVDLASSLHYDRATARERPGCVRLGFPLLVDDRQVGNAIVELPAAMLREPGRDPAVLALASALAGIAGLAALAVAQAAAVRRRLLVPLGEIGRAARRLAAGDLDARFPPARGAEVTGLVGALDALREGLRHSVDASKAADLARRELVAQISHDLRTPLASIRAYVEGIQEGVARDTDTVRRYLAVIHRKAESLAGLVEDLFQQSLADLERLPVKPEEQYSGPMLEAILEPLEVQHAAGSVAFEVEKPLPNVLVQADVRRVEQVVVNLVANARRNTPAGGRITVGAEVRERFLAVRVADTGRGIPEEELPLVFDRYYRGRAESRDSGSGLGLAICRYIVERHGGAISAESSPGRGTVFTFTLPKT